MSEDDLFAAAGVGFQNRGGLRLLNPGAIEKLLPVIRDNNFVVLGLEGFSVDPSYVEPRTDQIADFSSLSNLPWEDWSRVSVEETARFLSNHADRSLFFDISLRGPPV